MAAASVRSTKQPSHRAVDGDSPIFGRPPAITYARRMKPIPSQGRQFQLRDPYRLPPDSEDEDGPVPTTSVQQPDPHDSPLSDDELEVVYGNKRRHVKHKSARTKALSSNRSMHRGNAEQQTAAKKRTMQACEGQRSSSSSSTTKKRHARKQTNPRPTPARRSLHDVQSPSCRLPVNKLVMVLPPLENEMFDEPLSKPPTVEERDPITDITQHISTQGTSAIAEKVDGRGCEPVASTRKRVKSTKFKHKLIRTLRKKQHVSNQSELPSGDGFEMSELNLDRCLKIGKRCRKSQPLLLGFSTLTLQPGPLPEVKFEVPSSQLQLQAVNQKQEADAEVNDGRNDARDAEADDERATNVNNGHGDLITEGASIIESAGAQANAQVKNRRVSFDDQVRRQRISQQLSSISAPRRIYSISSNDSSGDREDLEPTDDEGEVEDAEQQDDRTSHYSFVEEDDAEDELNLQSEEAVPVPPGNQQARRISSYWSRASSPNTPAPARKDGVSLDFRKAMPPGLALPPTTLGKRRLVEVNDAIHDEPDQFIERPYSFAHELDDEMLDDDTPQRPLSILKNHTLHQQDVDTQPTATEANTRRNSMIMVDEESSYFATSMNMLQQPTDHPKLPILKHRSSQLRRSTSYYDEDLQPLSESPDYTNSNQLDVLRRSADAVWTSSRLATAAPRDLGALTRSVSKEYGTMSQSVRRRSSYLPFQSPTKMQRA